MLLARSFIENKEVCSIHALNWAFWVPFMLEMRINNQKHIYIHLNLIIFITPSVTLEGNIVFAINSMLWNYQTNNIFTMLDSITFWGENFNCNASFFGSLVLIFSKTGNDLENYHSWSTCLHFTSFWVLFKSTITESSHRDLCILGRWVAKFSRKNLRSRFVYNAAEDSFTFFGHCFVCENIHEKKSRHIFMETFFKTNIFISNLLMEETWMGKPFWIWSRAKSTFSKEVCLLQ